MGHFLVDASDSRDRYAAIHQVLRHHNGDALVNIIGCMKLTAKRPGLNEAAAAFCFRSERAVSPMLWNDSELGVLEGIGEQGEQFGSEAQTLADGVDILATGFGVNGIEIDEPRLKNGACHRL